MTGWRGDDGSESCSKLGFESTHSEILNIKALYFNSSLLCSCFYDILGPDGFADGSVNNIVRQVQRVRGLLLQRRKSSTKVKIIGTRKMMLW